MFEENILDGFEFDLIHLQEHSDEPLIRTLKFEGKMASTNAMNCSGK